MFLSTKILLIFFQFRFRWGVDHEDIAVELFVNRILSEETHSSFQAKEVGLVVSTSHPYLAASPDRLCNCLCCGNLPLEVKCPYNAREMNVRQAAASDKTFPLQIDEEFGTLYLNEKHDYYYQTQLQMLATNSTKCFFVIYTKCDLEYVIVNLDIDLVQEIKVRGKLYFMQFVLPELLAEMYTSSQSNKHLSIETVSYLASSNSNVTAVNNLLPCYCQTILPSEIETVVCSNENCLVKIFHKKCTQSTRFNRWMCVPCKKEAAKERLRMKKLPLATSNSIIPVSSSTTSSMISSSTSTVSTDRPLSKKLCKKQTPCVVNSNLPNHVMLRAAEKKARMPLRVINKK